MLDSLIVIGLATVSLGTIHEADGVQEHSFWLRNAGSEAVTLRQGYTSCGCTTIQYDKDSSIAPGDSTCVLLRFNPRGKGGEFEETGIIVYDKHITSPQGGIRGGLQRLSLSLVGQCITSEETLLRQFPIQAADGLRLSANRFDLGIMHEGESKERGVVVLYTKQENRQERIPVSFTVTKDTPRGLLHIDRPLKVSVDGNDITIHITLDVLVK